MDQNWDALSLVAGIPEPRVFTAQQRLFGAAEPSLRFWHDAAGWCPSCEAVFMVLEEMHVPYVLETSPLAGYMRPGEVKPAALLNIRPNGILPVVELLDRSVDDKSRVHVHAFRIIEVLAQEFPNHARLPRTPLRRACADAFAKLAENLCYSVEQQGAPEVLMGHLEHALSAVDSQLDAADPSKAPWADAWNNMQASDDGDGDDSCFGGSIAAGPFLFGKKPCAVDLMMLPWLERLEANLLPSDLQLRWPAAARLLCAAREAGVCSYSEVGCDLQTLLAIRMRFRPEFKFPLQEPTEINQITAYAGECDQKARVDAAARICANHAKIAAFSVNGKGMGSVQRDAKVGHRPAAVSAAVDDGLCLVAALLLAHHGESVGLTLQQEAYRGAHNIVVKHDRLETDAAISSLIFLSNNIGVPRDMAPAPADALRAHVRLVANSLIKLLAGDQELAAL